MTHAAAALRPRSMRARLLRGILLPLLGLISLNAWTLYDRARASADIAYDRTLLASAKAIGETLELTADRRVVARVPYAALEAFETDGRSRMVWKVLGFDGELVTGFDDLPTWHGKLPDRGPYAALVDFYDAEHLGEPVRAAVLLQPIAGSAGTGIATIQVAETLELRHALAARVLSETLWTQALLLAVIAGVVTIVVQRATQPVREISARIEARDDADLAPVDASRAPAELRPLVDATNRTMARLGRLLDDQKRFIRDASHQLRTPLAVLKAQLQSARRGDVEPAAALAEMTLTVDRAVVLANQMLSLAKVEQLRRQGGAPLVDWAEVVREVTIDLSPLIAERALDFELDAAPAEVRGPPWDLRELVRNLLHNAIRHTPPAGQLSIRLQRTDAAAARLTIADGGPGIDAGVRDNVFQPFSGIDAPAGVPTAGTSTGTSAGTPADAPATSGSGLGLAICHEIVQALGGTIRLSNRLDAAGRVAGLDAVVELPPAAPAQPHEKIADAPLETTATRPR